MTVLIAYATKYGTVRRVAEELQQKLSVPCDLADLSATPSPEVERYDVVLVGGSIYAGRIRSSVRKFCDRHREVLTNRRVGIFIACLYGEERGKQQLQENFPSWLLAHAFGRYNVGGAVELSRLGLVDRLIMQRVAKVHSDLDNVDREEIDRMVSEVEGVSGEPT
ncbi:MAG: flavodoxin domain-containing protein [Spirochaetia bacterium]